MSRKRGAIIIFLSMVFLCFILNGCSSTSGSQSNNLEQKKIEEAKNQAIKQEKLEIALKKVKTEKDDVKGIIWYKGLTGEDVDYNGIIPYIGTKVNQTGNTEYKNTWMRFYAIYSGKDWVFVEKIYLKTDKTTHVVNVGHQDRNTKVYRGGVAEWVDFSVDKKLYDILEDVSNSENVTMRFEGKNEYRDKVITKAEKENIRNILDIFNGFDGKLREKK